MTESVLVTRGGFGDVWYFPASGEEVRRHPLWQPGDSVLEEPSNLFPDTFLENMARFDHAVRDSLINYQVHEFVKLRRGRTDRQIVVQLREEFGSRAWKSVVERAQSLPSDPDDVIDQVRHDRDLITREKRTDDMAETKKVPAAATDPKPAKEKKEQLVRGHAMTAKMSFGQDKEGKAFGPKNNPKREGSASAGRYANYLPGKALSAQLGREGGPTLADLQYDSDPKRNWIVITD